MTAPKPVTFRAGGRYRVVGSGLASGVPIPDGMLFMAVTATADDTLWDVMTTANGPIVRVHTVAPGGPVTPNLRWARGGELLPGERRGSATATVPAQAGQTMVVTAPAFPSARRHGHAPPTSLTAMQSSALGHVCPVCGAGHIRAKNYTANGQPGVMAACDAFPRCVTSIGSDGSIRTRPHVGAKVSTVTAAEQTPWAPAPAPSVPAAPPVVPPPIPAAPVATPKAKAKASSTPTAAADLLAKIAKIRDDVRLLAASHQVSVGFSYRTWQFWLRVRGALLARHLCSEDDATDAGFIMAYLAKCSEEEAKPIGLLYQSVMGREPIMPLLAPADIVSVMWAERIPLWLHGPAGCGKTRAVLDVVRACACEPVRYQGTRQASVDELAGAPGLVAGSTVDQPGLIATAITEDRPLLLDEIDHFPGAVSDELRAILEDLEGGCYVNRRTGARLDASGCSYFWIVATANTSGDGNAGAFIGAGAVNLALRDRFVMYPAHFMDAGAELAAMGAYAATVAGATPRTIPVRPADYLSPTAQAALAED